MAGVFNSGIFNNAIFNTGATGTFGRSGLGGDDVPRKSPHKGWDRKEWKSRVKEPDEALEQTLKTAYAELTGETAPASVLARVDAIVRPVAKQKARDIPLDIDWAKIARDYEKANALYLLWREEQAIRAMEDDDEDVILMASTL